MLNWTKYNEDKSDWVLKNWTRVLKPKHSYKELKKAYWQSPVSKNSCSIHWVLTMVSNTFGIDFTLEERKSLWNEAKKLWASDEWGWRFAWAIKLVKSYCSEYRALEFNFYSIQSKEIPRYTKLWFPIYWWVKIKEWYNRDKLKDWFLWDSEDYWKLLVWHAICFTQFEDWNLWYVDNYPEKTKYNEVRFRDFQKLYDLWVFFNTAYICCTTEEIVKQGYNHLTLEEKVAKLRYRLSTYKGLNLKQIIARLKARNN